MTFWDALLILGCFVSGFVTKGLWGSVRERRVLNSVVGKPWNQDYDEQIPLPPVDIECVDRKFWIAEED